MRSRVSNAARRNECAVQELADTMEGLMMTSTPTMDQLSNVIAHATAPAFLLGALSGFIAILITRLNRIIDQPVLLQSIQDNDPAGARLRNHMPRLKLRARLINRAILWAVASSTATALLLIIAFAIAFFALPHE